MTSQKVSISVYDSETNVRIDATYNTLLIGRQQVSQSLFARFLSPFSTTDPQFYVGHLDEVIYLRNAASTSVHAHLKCVHTCTHTSTFEMYMYKYEEFKTVLFLCVILV